MLAWRLLSPAASASSSSFWFRKPTCMHAGHERGKAWAAGCTSGRRDDGRPNTAPASLPRHSTPPTRPARLELPALFWGGVGRDAAVDVQVGRGRGRGVAHKQHSPGLSTTERCGARIHLYPPTHPPTKPMHASKPAVDVEQVVLHHPRKVARRLAAHPPPVACRLGLCTVGSDCTAGEFE